MNLIHRFFTKIKVEYKTHFATSAVLNHGIVIPIDRNLFSKKMIHRLHRGTYEQPEVSAVEKVLKMDDIVLELGTGIGFISTVVSMLLGDKGEVYTYEANPSLIPIITKTYKANGVHPKPYNIVLDTKKSKIGTKQQFYIHENFFSSSFIKTEGTIEEKTVKVESLNEHLVKTGANFLIMDIEGYEYELLQGWEIPSQLRAIVMEVHPHKVNEIWDIEGFLERANFSIDSSFKKDNLVIAFRK